LEVISGGSFYRLRTISPRLNVVAGGLESFDKLGILSPLRGKFTGCHIMMEIVVWPFDRLETIRCIINQRPKAMSKKRVSSIFR
jgi:hypothetical protein